MRWCGSMAEHITRNDGVVGSIPTTSSKKAMCLTHRFFDIYGGCYYCADLSPNRVSNLDIRCILLIEWKWLFGKPARLCKDFISQLFPPIPTDCNYSLVWLQAHAHRIIIVGGIFYGQNFLFQITGKKLMPRF